jgi:hypothetical protein
MSWLNFCSSFSTVTSDKHSTGSQEGTTIASLIILDISTVKLDVGCSKWTSSKLNDLDRTYSNTSNNISSHIQTTDVHSNPVEQETHLDNMQSNTGKRLKMFFDAWTIVLFSVVPINSVFYFENLNF